MVETTKSNRAGCRWTTQESAEMQRWATARVAHAAPTTCVRSTRHIPPSPRAPTRRPATASAAADVRAIRLLERLSSVDITEQVSRGSQGRAKQVSQASSWQELLAAQLAHHCRHRRLPDLSTGGHLPAGCAAAARPHGSGSGAARPRAPVRDVLPGEAAQGGRWQGGHPPTWPG